MNYSMDGLIDWPSLYSPYLSSSLLLYSSSSSSTSIITTSTSTITEKSLTLKENQVQYKDEAVRLELALDVLREDLKVVVKKIYSVGK